MSQNWLYSQYFPYQSFAPGMMIAPQLQQNGLDEQQMVQVIQANQSIIDALISENSQMEQDLDQMIEVVSQATRKPTFSQKCHVQMHTDSLIRSAFQIASKDGFQGYLVLTMTDFAMTKYKESGFQLKVMLVDQQGQPYYHPNHSRFQVGIFTMDNPPSYLFKNVSGKPVIRGTTEIEMSESGEINFYNVVINEVSSHYSHNSFQLVVANVTSDQIKPLIIPNLFVKARKFEKKR